MKQILCTKKQFFKEYLIPLFLELTILFGLMGFCALIIYRGPMLQESVVVGFEKSAPQLGRLIYMFLSFFLFLIFEVLAIKYAKKEKYTPSFYLGFTAGILLWQSIGECSWHFQVGGVNFVCLETIASFPIFVVFVLTLIYARRNHSFDWGVWYCIASFSCNWIGHYITIGLHPFIEKYVSFSTWTFYISIIVGIAWLIASIRYLLFRVKTTRGRLYASMMTYIAIGIIALGLMEI